MTVDQVHPALGAIRQAGLPIEFGQTPGSIRTPPPLLGEHSVEVLTDIGYDGAAIEQLRRDGAI